MSDAKQLGAAIGETGNVMVTVGTELQGESPDVKALAEQLRATAAALTAVLPKADDTAATGATGVATDEDVDEAAKDAAAAGTDGTYRGKEGEGPTYVAWKNGKNADGTDIDENAPEPADKSLGGKKKKRRGGKSQRAWKKMKKGGRQSKRRR